MAAAKLERARTLKVWRCPGPEEGDARLTHRLKEEGRARFAAGDWKGAMGCYHDVRCSLSHAQTHTHTRTHAHRH
jgi:hypothetical protein